MSYATVRKRGANSDLNKLYPEDRAVHDWYRFVLSFPPHLVRDYLTRFEMEPGSRVLDPFCGTGTVPVEAKKHGIPSVGIEAHPMAHFASQVKVDWRPDPDGLLAHASRVAEAAMAHLQAAHIADEVTAADEADVGVHDGANAHFRGGSRRRAPALRSLAAETMALLLENSISPLPLHKTLVLLDTIEQLRDERFYRHELLALAKSVVFVASNLHFGPEVGVGPPKPDAPVVAPWLAGVESMASDLRVVADRVATPSVIHKADARQLALVLEPRSIDAVFTSPPYPNEKDYTRTTRLESVLLGFLRDKADLRAVKRTLVRSNTRNVYKGDDDSHWVAHHARIQEIAEAIEARRIELGKTSGFERLYATVTRLYFGGMARHLADLRPMLRPGAHVAYVVGDQASYLRIMIPTGQLLADIGESLGYEVEGIDLFRTRRATATKAQLREEVVVLRWPGEQGLRRSTHPLAIGSGSATPSGANERSEQVSSVNGGDSPVPDTDELDDKLLDEIGDEDASDLDEPAEVQAAKEAVKRDRASYGRIIEHIFSERYTPGTTVVAFLRDDIIASAQALGIKRPKNLGDVVYTFRYRRPLPDSILRKAPEGKEWIIRGGGDGQYRFVIVKALDLIPNGSMETIKVPDATPAIITRYRLNDEQALLAQLRYNRLVDLFTGITCYSLQSHLRTKVKDIGQLETDEVYIGVNRTGAQFVLPVQAKGGADKLGRVQVEQDLALCKAKFTGLVCRPIAAQFVKEVVQPMPAEQLWSAQVPTTVETIVLFELREQGDDLVVVDEKHYRLVPANELTPEELAAYRQQSGL